MSNDATNEGWLERWQASRTGWHEPDGNANLKAHWTGEGQRVLVPLCGKTPDLAWLEARGNEIVGVELSPIAAEAFFVEQGMGYRRFDQGAEVFAAVERRISIVCADYFDVDTDLGSFDACYDRGALVAIHPADRTSYVRRTLSLLNPGASYLLIGVEYDQSVADGPPFSLDTSTVNALLPSLAGIAEVDDLANCPPRFHAAGLKAFRETVYAGRVNIR